MSLLNDVLDLFGWTPPAGGVQPKSPRPAPARPHVPRPAPAPASTPAKEPAPAPAQKPAKASPSPVAPAPRPAGRPEGQALAVVARIAPQFRKVVYTRNRRVMASVAERGTALRLNSAFATAPDEVLVAVARLFSARDTRTRNRARDAVRAFIRGIPTDRAPVRSRTRQVHAGDQAHIDRLRAEFDRVNAAHFGGSLPSVPIYLSGHMRRRNGHFSTVPLEIVISRQLCTHALPAESEATMRHEMIHLWQHAQGNKPDHGQEFRAWARRLDVHPRATRPVKWEKRPGR